MAGGLHVVVVIMESLVFNLALLFVVKEFLEFLLMLMPVVGDTQWLVFC